MAPKALPGLTVRKLADTSEGERVARYHPETGEKHLVNPATGDPEPWPFAGLEIVGEAPKGCRVPTSFVARGLAEGWIEAEGESVVHRPGGPPEDVWRVTHTFVHYDAVVLKCAGGDVRYRVAHQPDKYVDGKPDSAEVTDEVYAAGETRVDHFFDLELEN